MIIGQDSFRGLMTQYARGSAGIIIVCDVTRRQTIDGVRTWKNEADKVLADCPPCILLVNKVSHGFCVINMNGCFFSKANNKVSLTEVIIYYLLSLYSPSSLSSPLSLPPLSL